jgi:hypothetical protein
MALNDLSVVAEDDGMVTRIERIVYIEGYKSLLVKDNGFASVDGFSSIIPHLVLQRCISRTNMSSATWISEL